MSFEPNQGQAPSEAQFLSRGPGYALLLTAGGAYLSSGSRPGSPPQAAIALHLLAASGAGLASGVGRLRGRSNYFIGNNPKHWRTNVPHYAGVRYRGVYPGVDLVYYGNPSELEYDFVIAPGASPARIGLRISGARLRVASDGSLVLTARNRASRPDGNLRLERPVAYQPLDRRPSASQGLPARPQRNKRREVSVRYRLVGRNEIRFDFGPYDPKQPLVIDPVLIYSTYLGGSGADSVTAIALDRAGNAYITGSTQSLNFPTQAPFQGTPSGSAEAFVTKLNPSGSALIYSTYLGGSAFDQGLAIAVDGSGEAFVAGSATSANFPATTGAVQMAYGGAGDGFVAELAASGSTLTYATYLGGSGADFVNGIAVDSAGNAYVTGSTQSANFPTANPLQSALAGASDAFITKIKSGGSALVYSTYFGGSAADSGQAIAIDGAGNAYVAGYTFSPNLPVVNPLQKAYAGNGDAFVAKLNAAGSALLYSTYLGGSGLDRAFGIAVDAQQNIYVTGGTASNDFPVTALALQPTNAGNGDAFLSKLNPSGSALVYSTFLGGSGADQAAGVAVDGAGDAYVTGFTKSADFPLAGAFQPALGGGTCGGTDCPDAFVSRVDPQGHTLGYSSYLGGSESDSGAAIAVDGSGNAYVAGGTSSPNFPAVAGAFQSVYGGSGSLGDGFVAKVSPADAPALALTPQQINFGSQGTGVATAPQTVTLTNAGSSPLVLSGFTVTGDFLLAAGGTCTVNTPLAPGANCTLNVSFKPTALGNRTGSLKIADNAAGSPQSVSLSGTGATPGPAATVSPASLTFDAEVVGTSSPVKVVTLTNSGTAALSITSIVAATNFSQTNGCGTSLAARASCKINVVFSPQGTGSASSGLLSGTITITDNASPATQTVTLSGTAVAVFSLTAPKGSTATATIGASSVTFTLGAAAPANFTSAITLGCSSAGSATCSFNPTSIKPGQMSTLTVSGLSGATANPFDFSATGTEGSGNSTQEATLALVINFADYSLAGAPPLVTLNAGQSATYTVTVTSLNGFSQAVTLSCSTIGFPQAASCQFSPSSVTPGKVPATSTLTVTTTAQKLAGTGPAGGRRGLPPPWWLLAVGMAGLGLIGSHRLKVARRARAAFAGATLAALLALAGLAAACNQYTGFNIVGTGGVNGTLAGNYQLVVVGTFTPTGGSAVTRTTTVNLSVGGTVP